MNFSSHRAHHIHNYFTFINVTNTTEKHSEVGITVLPIVWSCYYLRTRAMEM